MYEKAYEFSSSHLGPDKQVSKNLKNVLQSAQNQIKNKKIKKTSNISKNTKQVSNNKMRKTNMMHNHPYSETKEMSDTKMRTTTNASKRMGATGNISKNTTQNMKYINKDPKSGEDVRYKDQNYAGSTQDKGEIGDTISQEKADKKVKEHQDKAKQQNMKEEFDMQNDGGAKWENMISSREHDSEADGVGGGGGGGGGGLGLHPNGSDEDDDEEDM